MISSFKQYLVEEAKTVYFTFGRMNPPTIGHGKLLDALSSKAGRNPYRVYLSQSNDPKKNPLDYSSKVKHVRRMFPKHARQIMANKNVKTAMDALVTLYNEGFNHIVMIVGSDRVREFDVLANKYNGEKARHGFYNFESIKVVSAGERDPDAEGVEGMSASKQRENAKNNDFAQFSQGLPKSMSNKDARRLFNDIRVAMGLKEETEFHRHLKLEPVSDLREAYIRDNIFELGENVVLNRKDGIVGKIQYLGSNYLIVESKGERWRCWLDDVSKLDPNQEIRYQKFDIQATPEQGITKLDEAVAAVPKWKKAGPNGELEIKFPTGRRFKIEKQLDHNERHHGEWKTMEWINRQWEYDQTYSPKGYAKQKVMELGQWKNGKKVADYSATFQYESYQPEWGTPESTKKAKMMTPGETVKEGDSWRSEGHYTADGKEWKGDQHAYNGVVMTGKTHTKDSQKLYHYKELSADIRKKIEDGIDEGSKGLWYNIRKRREKGLPRLKPGDKNYPKTLDIEEQTMDRVKDIVSTDKEKLAKDKEAMKLKHDRLMDRARRSRMLQANKGVKS